LGRPLSSTLEFRLPATRNATALTELVTNDCCTATTAALTDYNAASIRAVPIVIAVFAITVTVVMRPRVNTDAHASRAGPEIEPFG